jgi:hypothetical protein
VTRILSRLPSIRFHSVFPFFPTAPTRVRMVATQRRDFQHKRTPSDEKSDMRPQNSGPSQVCRSPILECLKIKPDFFPFPPLGFGFPSVCSGFLCHHVAAASMMMIGVQPRWQLAVMPRCGAM